MRQSWPRISIANRMWGGLRAFSGPQYFYSTPAHVFFACACVKAFLLPALPSLRVGLGSCKYLKIFHWSSQCDGAWWLLLTWLSLLPSHLLVAPSGYSDTLPTPKKQWV